MESSSSASRRVTSYAPTKPGVKDVQSSSSSGYLNDLQPGVSMESRSYPATSDATVSGSAVETVVPVDTGATGSVSQKLSSYAPTKPGVRNLSSTSSGAYLDDLKGASPMESKSYPAASDSGAVDAVDESKATKRADAQHEVKVSYAPTKPGVKNLSSSSSSGYLNTFKPMYSSSIASLERDAAVERETVEMALPVRLSDVPRRVTSYAPTKPGVKDVQSSSSSSYLNVLQPSVSMESRSYPARSDATVSDSAVETVVSMDTRATGSKSRKVLSYAPTQPGVKNLSSTSSGAYLDDLKGASPMESKSYPVTRVSGAMDTVDESVSTEPPTTEGADARQEIKVSYAPTKTGVKNLSSSSSSGYLNTIKPMESSSSASRRVTSYAPTKPGVKDVQSSSSSGYLNDLQPGVSMESRSYPATSDATVSGSAVETVVPVDTGATGSVSQKLSSYAPTKPGVRNLSSTSSGAYLDDLKGASPMESKSYPAASDSGAVNAVDESKATKRADAQHEVKVSYAPTKPGVKNLSSSSSSGYLNTFKPMYSSSIASLERDAAVERETVETVLPVRPSDVPRRVTSYAPTKPGVKDVQSSSSSSYLNVLQPGVSMESRSYPATSDATVSDSAVETVVPVDTRATGSNSRKVLSYAPTQPGVKNLSSTSSGAYLDDLKGALPVESKSPIFASECGAVDAVDESAPTEPTTTKGAVARQETKVSYAPTKPGVKNLSSTSSSAYLDAIKAGVLKISSWYAAVAQTTASVGPDKVDLVSSAASHAGDKQAGSYAPTKPDVKYVQSSSSSVYLNILKPGVSVESSSSSVTDDAIVADTGVETVAPALPVDAVTTGSESRNLSYAPTQPGVKNLSSASSGVYLEDLKCASAMDSKSYPVASESGAVDEVDESVSTYPAGTEGAYAQQEIKVSYAPTKPGVKNHSSLSSSGYLNTIKSGEPMESFSFASLERDTAVEQETFETESPVRPSDFSRRVTSYAPTKPGVKDVPSSSSSGYLNVLQPGISESRSYPATSDATVSDSEVETVVPVDTGATGSASQKLSTYAPTKPGVRNLSSTSSGAYLDDLKGASPMESKSYPAASDSGAVDTVFESNATKRAGAQHEVKVSYAPTKPGVKNLSSLSSSGYLGSIKADVFTQPGSHPPGSLASTAFSVDERFSSFDSPPEVSSDTTVFSPGSLIEVVSSPQKAAPVVVDRLLPMATFAALESIIAEQYPSLAPDDSDKAILVSTLTEYAVDSLEFLRSRHQKHLP